MKTNHATNLLVLSIATVLLAVAQSSIAQDSNRPPVATIFASDSQASATSRDTGEFTVQISSRPDQTLTVFYAISGTASNGVDYQAISNAVTFDRWSDRAKITITPIPDTLRQRADGSADGSLTIYTAMRGVAKVRTDPRSAG